MKRIKLEEISVEFVQVLELANDGPVVLLGPNGREYVLAAADDFDQEVEQLRNSVAFQNFLDERSTLQRPRRSLTTIAHAIEEEIAQRSSSD